MFNPPTEYRGLPRIPMWPPGPEIGWTPFRDHIRLPLDPYTSIETYLSEYDDLLDSWVGDFGIIDSYQLENDHGWNITRLVLINGQIYNKPAGPAPPENNISVGAIYLMETDERPYEFVWWEMIPMTWVFGWRNSTWLWNLDVPKALEKKLLEEEDALFDIYDIEEFPSGSSTRLHMKCYPPVRTRAWYESLLLHEWIKTAVVILGCFVVAATLRLITTLWERSRAQHLQKIAEGEDQAGEEAQKLMEDEGHDPYQV